MLAAYGIPIALFALHRFLRLRQARYLVLFTSAFLLQALTNGYYLMFQAVLVAMWAAWFVRSWRVLGGMASAGLAALLLLAPLLLKYQSVHSHHELTRNLENVRLYSADLTAALSASSDLAIWGSLMPARNSEGMLFAGFAVTTLVIAGAVRGRRSGSVFAFYVAAAVAMYALALGPSPGIGGKPLLPWGPYAALTDLPGFSSLRVPARFGMLFALCVPIAASLAFARLTHAWTGRRRWMIAGVLAGTIAAESWPKALPLWEPPANWTLQPTDGRGPLLVLPMLNELNEAASMYRAMSHRRPLVNGYSGHIPPWYLTLKEALDARDPAVLEELAGAGVAGIAVVLRNDRDGSWRDFVRASAAPVRESPEEGFALFALPSTKPRRPDSTALAIAAVHVNRRQDLGPVMVDGRIDTWWSTFDPQSGGEEVLIDLGSDRNLAAVELWLGPTGGFEFPRHLTIDVSSDTSRWTKAWAGATAGGAVGASMRDHSTTRLHLEIAPSVARFIRLRQTGMHRRAPWTIAELRVLAR